MATYFPQLLLTMTVSMGFLTIGLIRGWSSPGIPSLIHNSPHLVPTNTAISWISAVPPLGAFCGSLVAGPFLQRLGRKKTLLIVAPFFCLSWIIIGAAVNIAMLIVGRVLTGVCAGIVLPSAQVYVSECAHPDIRGILGSLPALFMAAGVLISYVLGTWLRWDYLAFVSAVFPAGLFFFLLPLPESPSWLHSRGLEKAAISSAEWFKHERKASIELKVLSSSQKKVYISETDTEMIKFLPKSKHLTPKGMYSTKALLRRPVLIPFGLVVGVLIFQQVSGIDTVLFYTVSIFEASGTYVNNYLATVLVGLVQVIATVISLFIIDRYGRKPLLIFSGIFMGISMAALGFYFYVHERRYPIVMRLSLLPVVSLMVFIGAFALGFANVPYLLMGELLPVRQRSVLSSVASAFNVGTMFLVIKSYHDIKDLIGDGGVFWGYAIICVAGCLFVLFFIPETKGKSLEEIERYFEGVESNTLPKDDKIETCNKTNNTDSVNN